MLGEDLVVGVEDLEVDVFVDDLAPVDGDFLVAPAAVDVLPATTEPDVLATVFVGPEEDEYLDGGLEAVVVRLLTTEALADFVDKG